MSEILFPVIRESEQVLPFVLNGLASEYPVERIVRPQGLESGWWLLTRSGSGRVITGKLVSALSPGQAVWIAPGEPHELVAGSQGWIVDWLSISGRGLPGFSTDPVLFDQTQVISIADDENLREIMTSILATRDDLTPWANRLRSTLVYSYLLEIERQLNGSPEGHAAQREKRLVPVLDYISQHFQEAIGLPKLAELMGVTPQHLCTMFRKLMGMRIFEYINLIRIQFSKAELIANPGKAVRDVAHASGFDDVSYFCSIFKRFEKMTPGEYRKLFSHS